ncbi:MAG: phosphotransferase [Dehalococcoidia bacterium]|nr:phosphotransferase [Dehalococcoidia bacterium]
MTVLRIPAGVNSVTPDWLTAALGTVLAPGSRVRAVDSTRIGEGSGFLGELARMKLAYEGDPGPAAPASVIVKLPTRVAEARGMAAVLGFYEREVGFYRDIGYAVGVRTPKPYYALFEPAEADFALVLEDVTTAQVGDQLASCSIEQAKLAVTTLGQLHGKWWQSAQLTKYAWLPSRGHPFYQVLKFGFVQNLPQFTENWAHRFDPLVLRCAEGLAEKFDEYLDGLFDRPLTLVHSDFRLDNLMFGEPGSADACVVLDWQICSASIGSLDLQYFISGNLRKDVIAKHTDELLDTYYEALRGAGVTDYSMHELRDDYARTSLILALYIVTNSSAIDPKNYDQRGNDLIELIYASLGESMVRYEAERFLP